MPLTTPLLDDCPGLPSSQNHTCRFLSIVTLHHSHREEPNFYSLKSLLVTFNRSPQEPRAGLTAAVDPSVLEMAFNQTELMEFDPILTISILSQSYHTNPYESNVHGCIEISRRFPLEKPHVNVELPKLFYAITVGWAVDSENYLLIRLHFPNISYLLFSSSSQSVLRTPSTSQTSQNIAVASLLYRPPSVTLTRSSRSFHNGEVKTATEKGAQSGANVR